MRGCADARGRVCSSVWVSQPVRVCVVCVCVCEREKYTITFIHYF